MNAEAKAALEGRDVQVDANSIEANLADMWRAEGDASKEAVTRAALWNVVAHTDDYERKNMASEVLSQVSVRVPQRTIVVRASVSDPAEMTSWISANCHIVGGEKQICSEEISIVAGGDRVRNVPSLVQALLLPDMPVATWWVGDLPNDQEYVRALLDPADRLIVDSSRFDQPGDLELVAQIARDTKTAPADLSWARLEDWRTAAASAFDASELRSRLSGVTSMKVVSSNGSALFGELTQSYFFASWMAVQLRRPLAENADGILDWIGVELAQQPSDAPAGSLLFVELRFREGSTVSIERSGDGAAITTSSRGVQSVGTVTRTMQKGLSDLVTRQLAQREDAIYRKVLPVAASLARKVQK